RAFDGRGPATSLEKPLFERFGISRPDEIIRILYDQEYPRHEVAFFSVEVEKAAAAGDGVALEILAAASMELVLAAKSVTPRLRLEEAPYAGVLSGGPFAAPPSLEASVRSSLARGRARVLRLEDEPAAGAVLLALEELGKSP